MPRRRDEMSGRARIGIARQGRAAHSKARFLSSDPPPFWWRGMRPETVSARLCFARQRVAWRGSAGQSNPEQGKVTASERSAEAARLLWEQAVAGSIPAAPTMIFPPGHSVLSPVGPRRSSILTTGIWGHSSEGEHRLCTAATWVQFPLAPPARRDGRAADCGGLENC